MGEHHVGTLDLRGEGNRAEVASPITDAMVEAALIAAGHTTLHGHRVAQIRAALEATYPAIREQVAEEIAAAIAVRRDEITPGRPGWVYLTEAIRITREIGERGGVAPAPGGAGGASGRTGLSASPGLERNDL